MQNHLKIGVLLMSYGSIYKINDVERFYIHILKGKKPNQELLKELKSKFIAIGGISPLNSISFNQAKKLQEKLPYYKVYLAFKHINPYIEDVVKQMEEEGIQKAIALVLSPYYSNYNISDYFKRTFSSKIKFHYVYGYYDNPILIDIFAKRIEELRRNFLGKEENIFYLFSAHSLPEKVLPDPYPEQLSFVINKIVEKLKIKNYIFCYQSQGKSGDKWLGPNILDAIKKIPDDFKVIISCPIGFISEHLEILYDIDIEARNFAFKLGKQLYRIKLPNDDDDFIFLLKNVVETNLKKSQFLLGS